MDEAGNKLLAKAVIICKMTPFIFTEEGDIDYLAGSKMETVYQVDDQYFEFLEKLLSEVQAQRSQGIITSVFRVLMGS